MWSSLYIITLYCWSLADILWLTKRLIGSLHLAASKIEVARSTTSSGTPARIKTAAIFS